MLISYSKVRQYKKNKVQKMHLTIYFIALKSFRCLFNNLHYVLSIDFMFTKIKFRKLAVVLS